jgi:hypothetical protein
MKQNFLLQRTHLLDTEEAGDVIGRVVADVVPVTSSEILVGEVAGDEVVEATGVVVAGAVA